MLPSYTAPILSAYLDVLVRPSAARLWFGSRAGKFARQGQPMPWNKTRADFSLFVKELVAHRDQNRPGIRYGSGFTEGHFLPAWNNRSFGCRRRMGMGALHDAGTLRVLKLEDMALWYAGLVEELGLTATVRDRRWEGGCFWRPTNSTCRAALAPPATSKNASHSTATHMRKCSAAPERQQRHETGACAQLAQYYDCETAARVRDWAAIDFETFGYDSWTPPGCDV